MVIIDNLGTYILVEAGTQRYNVGTDTPKLWATSLGDLPEESSFLLDDESRARLSDRLNAQKSS
jgi:hypothetical protein